MVSLAVSQHPKQKGEQGQDMAHGHTAARTLGELHVERAHTDRLAHISQGLHHTIVVPPETLAAAARMADPTDPSHTNNPARFPHRRSEIWDSLLRDGQHCLAPALTAALSSYWAYNPLSCQHEVNPSVLPPVEVGCQIAKNGQLPESTRELALACCALSPVTEKGRKAVASLLAETPPHDRTALHKALRSRLGLS